MNGREVTGLAMMIGSFPLTYLVPFPIAGATLFAIICTFFSVFTSKKRMLLVFFPLYLIRTWSSLIIAYDFFYNYVGMFPNELFIIFMRQPPIAIMAVALDFVIVGLSTLYGAQRVLKRFKINQRLGVIKL